MSKTLLLVGLGGFMGTILRYLITVFFTRNFTTSFIPYGTLAVNFLGCLAIGIIYGLAERFNFLSHEWRVFLITGFCGGFTTYSAFAYENVSMLHQSNYLGFAVYSIATFVICIGAVFIGLVVVKFPA